MKKLITLLFILFCSFFITMNLNAQVDVSNGGPVTTYANIKLAFDAINGGTHTGAILIQITGSGTYTDPAASAVLNSSGAGSASYTSVLIQPSADAVSIIATTTTGRGVIELNGADNVTIDGDNPNTGGTNRNLTITNIAASVTTYTSAVRIALSTLVTSANSDVVKNCNINGSAIGRNNSIYTGSAGSMFTTYGILVGGGASTVAVTTAPSAITSVTTVVGVGITATSFSADNNVITACGRGIAVMGSAITVANKLAITNNVIGSPSAGDSTTVYARGITIQGFDSTSVSGNRVQNIQGYPATQIMGISLGTESANGTNATVKLNKVNNVNNRSLGTFGSYGINSAAGANMIIVNNFISAITGDMTGGAAFSTTFGLFGIRLGTGTGHKVYHNSVNMFGLRTGTATTSLLGSAFCLVSTTSTGCDVRNNIFSNTVTGGTTSISYTSVFLPSSATVALNLTINNNAYYSGSIIGSTGVANVGTTYTSPPVGPATYMGVYPAASFDPSVTTGISNFRSYSSTLSAGALNDNASWSVTTAAPFVSTSDLHLNTGLTPTFLESKGVSAGITGIITDIDNQVRPGPAGSVNGGATTPDLGADEFDGTPFAVLANDVGTISINVPSTLPPSPIIPQATIKNFGSAMQTFNVTMTISPGGYTSTQTVSSLTPGSTQNVNFSSWTPAVGTPTITCFTQLVGDENRSNDTLRSAVNVNTPLAGDYTVGTALFNSITGRNITFEKTVKTVIKEVYERVENNDRKNLPIERNESFSLISEDVRKVMKEVEEITYVPMENGINYTGPLYVKRSEFPNLSGKADIGVYATITAAVNDLNLRGVSAPVRFLLLDASYPTENYPITINSINGGSAVNTLTIKPNTGVTSSVTGSSAVSIFKINGADYVTIDGSNNGSSSRDLIITNTNPGTTSIVVWLNSTTLADGANNNTIKNCNINGNAPTTTLGGIVSSGSVAGSVAEAANSNNTYQNNVLTASNYGISAVGPNGNESGTLITGNQIGSAIAGSKMGLIGIAIFQQMSAIVSNNTISGITSSSNGPAFTTSGIKLSGTHNGSTVTSNKISDIKQTHPSGWGSNGIWLNASTTTSNVTVANNFIWDVASYGYLPSAGVPDNGYGIVAASGGGYKIYFNSVSLNTNQTVNGLPAALNITNGITTAGSLDIRNNIFSNTQTVGTNRYSVYCGVAASVFGDINYNDYYFAAAPNLGFLGSNRATLASWQTASGKDANSISGDPLYISASNLHIDSTGASPVNSSGTSIAGITTDIDGSIRNVTTPDIGADEFSLFSPCGVFKLNERFSNEDFPPEGWTSLSLNSEFGSWKITSDSTHTIPGAAISELDSSAFGAKNYLISKRFVPGAGDSLVFYLQQLSPNVHNDSLEVRISTSDSLIPSFTTRLLGLRDGVNYPTAGTYGRFAVNLNAFANQTCWIAFYHVNANGEIVMLDDITIGCPPVNSVRVVAITDPNDTIGVGDPLDSLNEEESNIAPSAIIINEGTADQTTPFSVTFQLTGPSNYTSTIYDTLSSGLSREIFFDSTFNPIDTGDYDVNVFTSVGDDLDNTGTINPVLRKNGKWKGLFRRKGHKRHSCETFWATTNSRNVDSKPEWCWKPTNTIFEKNLILNGRDVSGGLLAVGDLDNGYFAILNSLPGTKKIKLCGVSYNNFYIGTNGVVGLGNEDGAPNDLATRDPEKRNHIKPAIIPLWNNLSFKDSTNSNRLSYRVINYSGGGSVLVITYEKAKEINRYITNSLHPDNFAPAYVSFQTGIELIDEGTDYNSNFRFSYADTLNDGLTSAVFIEKAGERNHDYWGNNHIVGFAASSFGNIVNYRIRQSNSNDILHPNNGYRSFWHTRKTGPLFENTGTRHNPVWKHLAVEFGHSKDYLNNLGCNPQDKIVGCDSVLICVSRQGPIAFPPPSVPNSSYTVYLTNPNPPYNIVDSAKGTTGPNGCMYIKFTKSVIDASYYIVIKNKNSLETWSKTPRIVKGINCAYLNLMDTNALAYINNIASGNNNAYGNNMIFVNNRWCIYSGDVNQDGAIDLNDVIQIYNDAASFTTGVTDLNDDGVTDLTDLLLAYNNAINFVQISRP